MKKVLLLIIILTAGVLITACQPQTETVEVTRVVTETVTETQEVEVTRIVEGEVVTETVVEEVEVTRIVEVAPETDESGPRTLTLFTTEADPPQLEVLSEIIDEYHEMHPDVFIDVVTGTPSTRGERIATLLAAGADAGIFEMEARTPVSLKWKPLLPTIGPMPDSYCPSMMCLQRLTAKMGMSPVATLRKMVPSTGFLTPQAFMGYGSGLTCSKKPALNRQLIMRKCWLPPRP
jgi:ABC-type glycerol-3-phosphate transport system substrate-binding protein